VPANRSDQVPDRGYCHEQEQAGGEARVDRGEVHRSEVTLKGAAPLRPYDYSP
jgi:hypothetical protein